MCPQLSAFDATLLRQYISCLPSNSLHKVVVVSRVEHNIYLASKAESEQAHGSERKVSNMAMRRILRTTFEKLACDDEYIRHVYNQWPVDKPKKKGKNCQKEHTSRWLRRRDDYLVGE